MQTGSPVAARQKGGPYDDIKRLKEESSGCRREKSDFEKKELLNTGAEIVVKEIIEDGVEISVYDNGYVLYEEGRHRTVFRLHECKDYDYSAVDGRTDAFGADFFENENWYILPLMVGMDRVEDSRRRILSNHKVISIDIEENDFFSIKARCVPDMTEKVLWNEMMSEISDLLNERQRYAVIAYYCEGASQAEIARNLEISQQAASGLIQRALVIIRNYMQVNPSDVKRKRNKK